MSRRGIVVVFSASPLNLEKSVRACLLGGGRARPMDGCYPVRGIGGFILSALLAELIEREKLEADARRVRRSSEPRHIFQRAAQGSAGAGAGDGRGDDGGRGFGVDLQFAHGDRDLHVAFSFAVEGTSGSSARGMRDDNIQYTIPIHIVKLCNLWSKMKSLVWYTAAMSTTIVIAIFGTIITILLLVILLRGNRKDDGDRSFAILQDQLDRLTNTLDDRFHRSSSELNQALRHQGSDTQRLIQDITRELTEVKESNKQVFSITEQLQNLEKVLKHQKQRGNLGEAQLSLILDNILPAGAYKMQHQFKNGEVVDAIINTKEGIIPVDSKFSLDNYNRIVNEKDELERERLEGEFRRDLKLRIDETAKYIRPEEGTLPFAFMFIPAEGIYYDLLVNEVGAVKVNTRSLIDYAYKDKNVIIVSPTTFYAYLHSVLHGFRAFKIEESAKGIQKRVEELGKHLAAYEDYMKKLGGTLGTTVNHYNTAYKELKKVDKDVLKISGEAAGIEPTLLDKPTLDEE